MKNGINLHVYPSQMTHESRILKESKCICDLDLFERIVLVGMWREGLKENEDLGDGRVIWRVKTKTSKLRLPFRLSRIINLWEWKWRILRRFREENVAMVNCHNLATLPLGYDFKRTQQSKLVYDTHELETERGWPSFIANHARNVERRLIGKADLTVVVSESIRQWYNSKYNINDPLVIRNIPPAYNLENRKKVDLKAHFGIPNNQLMFIFQGALGAGRCVEIVLEAFKRCKHDRHVVFMGFGQLQSTVENAAQKYANIHFHPAVNPSEVLDHTRSADVGIHLLTPDSLNHKLTLGNKPFEYLLAGLPFLESDYTEGARFVKENSCGWLVETAVEPILSKVNELDRSDIKDKREIVMRIRNDFSWEKESNHFGEKVAAMFCL